MHMRQFDHQQRLLHSGVNPLTQKPYANILESRERERERELRAYELVCRFEIHLSSFTSKYFSRNVLRKPRRIMRSMITEAQKSSPIRRTTMFANLVA